MQPARLETMIPVFALPGHRLAPVSQNMPRMRALPDVCATPCSKLRSMPKISLLLAFLLLNVLSAAAQPYAPAGSMHRVAGTQIPRSQLVESFLRVNHKILTELPEEFRLDLLDKLGLKPGSKAEEALRQAAQKMRLLDYGEAGPIVVTESETGSVTEYRHLGPEGVGGGESDPYRKAVETGKIFGQLLRELRDADADLEKIDAYLLEEVAPGMSITSDEPFDEDHPLRLRSEAFEAEVEKALR